jgi:hypothetical protein
MKSLYDKLEAENPVLLSFQSVSYAAGSWLTACPDRYSYFHRIVPLLLTSIHDDVAEVGGRL